MCMCVDTLLSQKSMSVWDMCACVYVDTLFSQKSMRVRVYVYKTVHKMSVVTRAGAQVGMWGTGQNLPTWSLVDGLCSVT